MRGLGENWSVTLYDCVCPCFKRKTTWAINTKLGTHILYGRTSAPWGQKVKGRGHRSMKCWQRGCACRYDCLGFWFVSEYSVSLHGGNVSCVSATFLWRSPWDDEGPSGADPVTCQVPAGVQTTHVALGDTHRQQSLVLPVTWSTQRCLISRS